MATDSISREKTAPPTTYKYIDVGSRSSFVLRLNERLTFLYTDRHQLHRFYI